MKASQITVTNTRNPEKTGMVTADGAEAFYLDSGESLILDGNVKLSGRSGGSVYFSEGAVVSGVSGMFRDEGLVLSETGEVTVEAEGTPAAETGLTAGQYIYDGEAGLFSKGKGMELPTTGLKDGILTILPGQEKVSGTGWEWNPAKNELNVNSRFADVKQIVFGEGIEKAAIKVNSGVSISPSEGEAAIILNGDLTIDTASELKLRGTVKASRITVTNTRNPEKTGMVIADGAEAFHLDSGESLILDGNAKLSGRDGGSIYFGEGAVVSGMAGMFSDRGSLLKESGEVVVGNAEAEASETQLAEGVYTYDSKAGVFVKGEAPDLPVTGLKDGVLILTSERGGNKEQGWDWSSKGVLNVNSRFTGIKQIVFADSVANAVIKLNSGITLTPESGMPAIVSKGNISITADKNYSLKLGGSVTAKNLTVQGYAGIETEDTITAENSISILEQASVAVSADVQDPALCGKNGTITVGGTATVIVRNRNGAAMMPAPDVDGYEGCLISASEYAGGKPGTAYIPEEIENYRYLKIEKKLTAAEIEAGVEALGEDASPAIVGVLADQIRNLSPEELKTLKAETLEKMDQLLQKATDISVTVKCRNPLGLSENKRIQGAEIHGAFLAADISPEDTSENTELTVRLTQTTELKLNNKNVLTMTFELYKNEQKAELKTPLTVTVTLPGEFYPKEDFRLHMNGNGLDEWMDLNYDAAGNTISFCTDRFVTLSIVNPNASESSSGGSSGGSGGGSSSGGRGGGGGSFAAGPVSPLAPGGKWIQDSVGWWYQYDNKTYPKNGWAKLKYNGKEEWYFFDQNGYMVTGWVQWNGKWYYMSTASDGTNGIMLTGWQNISGKRYYFSEAADSTIGIMMTNIRIQEFYLGEDGIAR